MRVEDFPAGREQKQAKTSRPAGEETISIDHLLELAKRKDSEALEALLAFFEKDIDILARKAKHIGIPEDEAKQFILLYFIELLVEGKL
ncbi:hypothetical protein [Cohnella panacarvi]|uniref:hypothetical protein n=1 Tax=Cohnella panacarvi TaxID=400776 RepID=UPI0012EBCCA4|nr:hypothetical protein [Cohnella panacarvi]